MPIRCLDYTGTYLAPRDYFFEPKAQVIEPLARATAWHEERVLSGVQHASSKGFSPDCPMQRTRDEVEELLHKSQESLKKSVAANRKLKAVMTKVNKVVGRRTSVKRKVKR